MPIPRLLKGKEDVEECRVHGQKSWRTSGSRKDRWPTLHPQLPFLMRCAWEAIFPQVLWQFPLPMSTTVNERPPHTRICLTSEPHQVLYWALGNPHQQEYVLSGKHAATWASQSIPSSSDKPWHGKQTQSVARSSKAKLLLNNSQTISLETLLSMVSSLFLSTSFENKTWLCQKMSEGTVRSEVSIWNLIAAFSIPSTHRFLFCFPTPSEAFKFTTSAVSHLQWRPKVLHNMCKQWCYAPQIRRKQYLDMQTCIYCS